MNEKPGLNDKVKAFVIIAITSVVVYKIIVTPIDLDFNFANFLSLILALFSVALAATFYFKATDTSNTFYDNTYKFTKDIAELLVRIESGFGEKLQHLDETYKGMKDRFEQFPTQINIENAKEKAEEDAEDIENIRKERDELFEELVNKTQLNEEEREKFYKEMKIKDKKLFDAMKELDELKHFIIHSQSVINSEKNRPKRYDSVAVEIINMLGGPSSLYTMSKSKLKQEFVNVIDGLPVSYKNELRKQGIVDSNYQLTNEGAAFMQKMAMDAIHLSDINK